MGLFWLVTAAVFGLALYLIRRDWPWKRGKAPAEGQPEGDAAQAR